MFSQSLLYVCVSMSEWPIHRVRQLLALLPCLDLVQNFILDVTASIYSSQPLFFVSARVEDGVLNLLNAGHMYVF